MLRWCRNTEKRNRHSMKWPLPVPPSGLLLQKLRWKFYGKGAWKEVASCILTISLRLKPLFSPAICNHRNTHSRLLHTYSFSPGAKRDSNVMRVGWGRAITSEKSLCWTPIKFIFSHHLPERPTALSCFSPRVPVVSIMLCCTLRLRDLHNDLWAHKIMCF